MARRFVVNPRTPETAAQQPIMLNKYPGGDDDWCDVTNVWLDITADKTELSVSTFIKRNAEKMSLVMGEIYWKS